MSQPIFEPPTASSFAAALQAQLDAIPTVAAFIATPLVEKPATGYVWAQIGGVDEIADRMTGMPSDGGGSVILHCCGYSPTQTVHTDDLVAARLRGWRPSAEPHVSPLRLTSVSEVITDASVPTDVRYSITRIYRYDS